MKKYFSGLSAAGLVLLLVWALIFPLFVIWAANTLFSLGLAYTFWNWLATIVLMSVFGRSSITVKK
jgi:hypothetical protein